MTGTLNIPSEFDPPEELLLGSFRLEALHPKHNDRDYAAWNSNIEDILKVLDPNDPWMSDVLNAEMNLNDLSKDYQEFLDKICFRYAILNHDGSEYQGCFYIRPTTAIGYQCRIEYWFSDEAKRHEQEFHETIMSWLKETWKFSKMALPGREMSWKDYHAKGG